RRDAAERSALDFREDDRAVRHGDRPLRKLQPLGDESEIHDAPPAALVALCRLPLRARQPLNQPLYDRDFYAWTQKEADAIRRRSVNELDWSTSRGRGPRAGCERSRFSNATSAGC